MRTALLITILFSLLTRAVSAQDITSSIVITVYDRSDVGLIIMPKELGLIAVGDTLTFQASAVDSITGNTIPTVVQWISSDTTVMRININTGFATFTGRGSVTLDVFAEIIVFMQVTAVISRIRGGVDTVDLGTVRVQPISIPRLPSWWQYALAFIRR